jgi:hypothetical protein
MGWLKFMRNMSLVGPFVKTSQGTSWGDGGVV